VLVVDGKGVYKIWYKGVEVAEAEEVLVDVAVGGSAVGLTEAISLPTVMSTPQTSGNDSVAE
jgi:(2Fe-2S) ferredoxin